MVIYQALRSSLYIRDLFCASKQTCATLLFLSSFYMRRLILREMKLLAKIWTHGIWGQSQVLSLKHQSFKTRLRKGGQLHEWFSNLLILIRSKTHILCHGNDPGHTHWFTHMPVYTHKCMHVHTSFTLPTPISRRRAKERGVFSLLRCYGAELCPTEVRGKNWAGSLWMHGDCCASPNVL